MTITRALEHQAKIDAWNERQRKARKTRLSQKDAAKTAAKEIDLFTVLEARHDLWWTVAYRDKKPCRICKEVLPLSRFDKGISMDGLKHECKKCAYERYVKPRMAEMAARTRAWQKANPEKTRASKKKHRQKPHMRMRARLVKRLKALIGRKSERYVDLIGCSPKALVAHLQSLFKPGMSWENTRGWHIDHKIPCRAFDLTKKEERLKCFHYTNLQPLWAAENAAKSDQLSDGSNARDLTPALAPVTA